MVDFGGMGVGINRKGHEGIFSGAGSVLQKFVLQRVMYVNTH